MSLHVHVDANVSFAMWMIPLLGQIRTIYIALAFWFVNVIIRCCISWEDNFIGFWDSISFELSIRSISCFLLAELDIPIFLHFACSLFTVSERKFSLVTKIIKKIRGRNLYPTSEMSQKDSQILIKVSFLLLFQKYTSTKLFPSKWKVCFLSEKWCGRIAWSLCNEFKRIPLKHGQSYLLTEVH